MTETRQWLIMEIVKRFRLNFTKRVYHKDNTSNPSISPYDEQASWILRKIKLTWFEYWKIKLKIR